MVEISSWFSKSSDTFRSFVTPDRVRIDSRKEDIFITQFGVKKQKSCFKHFLSFWITTTSHFTFAATKMTRRHHRDTWTVPWNCPALARYPIKNCVPTVYEMQSYVDNLRCTQIQKKMTTGWCQSVLIIYPVFSALSLSPAFNRSFIR